MTQATEAALHIAGTSCVDYSDRGEQAKEEGPTVPHTMCWCCMRAMLQEAYIIHENVEAFDPKLLKDCLGMWYEVDSTVIDCGVLLAWPCSRLRRYTILRHKTKSLPFRSPISIFTKLFARKPIITCDHEPAWSCFFAATPKELLDEMQWAASRPSSNFDKEHHKLDIYDPNMFFVCLNNMETNFLQQYNEKFHEWPGIAFSLNQDPSFGPTHSSTSHLHTLIRNMGIIWILSLN